MNHVHKDSKDLVSIVITLEKFISVLDTAFYDGVNTYELGSRYHVLKNLHGRMIFGTFETKSIKVIFEEDIDL